MPLNALGKHGWSLALGVLLSLYGVGPCLAARALPSAEIAIGSPLPNSLVAGRITLSIAYNTGASRISSFTIFVDDEIHSSRDLMGMNARGIQYLELDTRTLADGNHTLKIVARGMRGMLASDSVDLTIRNGVPGGADTVPPLVHFRGLTDGDTVSGKVSVDLLAEDNTTNDLLVSIFVNRFPTLIKSSPPYSLELNTSQYLDPATGVGSIQLEAWAYDKFNNLGKARPVTLRVIPAAAENNTTRQDDPTRAITRMMPQAAEPKEPMAPAKAQVESRLTIPLGPRGEAPGRRVAAPPSPAVSVKSVPVAPPVVSKPPVVVAKAPVVVTAPPVPAPATPEPQIARNNVGTADPDLSPLTTPSASRLAGGKPSVPNVAARPRVRVSAARPKVQTPKQRVQPTVPAPMGGRTQGAAAAPPKEITRRPVEMARSITSDRVIGTLRATPAPSVPPAPEAPLPAAAPPVRAALPPVHAPVVAQPSRLEKASPPAVGNPQGTAAAPLDSGVKSVTPGTRPPRPVEVARAIPTPAATTFVRPVPGAATGAAVTSSRAASPLQAARNAASARQIPGRAVAPVAPTPVELTPTAVARREARRAPAAPGRKRGSTREMATARIGGSHPEIIHPGETLVIPVPGMTGDPVQSELRNDIPEVAPPAPAPGFSVPSGAIGKRGAGAPIVVVVDKARKPDARGRVPVQIWRLNTRGPRDRTHRLQRGEDLGAVARKFSVTRRSLQVANALPAGRARAGSMLKIPGSFEVVVNNRRVGFDVAPRVEQGVALAPFRQIFEHAGGIVVWSPGNREVQANRGDTDLKLQIGRREAVLNQVIVVMEREAFLEHGRAIVPLSFMEKALDLTAEFDVKSGSVLLVRR